jgi:membrane fusion protein (multidrug efflux system)
VKKAIGWIILGLIVILAGWRIIQAISTRQRTYKKLAEQTEVKTAVKTVSAALGEISSSITFTGTVVGDDQATAYSDAPGKLLRYEVQEGQHVSRDQTIALIDRSIPGMEYKPARARAPISGTVSRLFLDQGAMVAPQIPVALVINTGRLKVAFNVSERYRSLIRKGMAAAITVDNLPDRRFEGTIDRVSSFVDPSSRAAYAEVVVRNPKGLMPGNFADVVVVTETHTDALVLPREAVIENLASGDHQAYVIVNGKASLRTLEVGIMNDRQVEVRAGIDPGDQVVTSGKEFLKDGAELEVVE